MRIRALQLGVWILGLWFFFAVLTPRIEALSPSWQAYNATQEKYDLDSGALYYTNVPVTQEAEMHVREAVRKGMKDWRARH